MASHKKFRLYFYSADISPDPTYRGLHCNGTFYSTREMARQNAYDDVKEQVKNFDGRDIDDSQIAITALNPL